MATPLQYAVALLLAFHGVVQGPVLGFPISGIDLGISVLAV